MSGEEEETSVGVDCEPQQGEDLVEQAAEIDFFSHGQEVYALIEALDAQCCQDFSLDAVESPGIARQFHSFEAILDRYLEVPHVVRPHLDHLVPPLIAALRRRMPTLEWLREKLESERNKAAATEASVESTTGKLGHDYTEYDHDAPRTAIHHFSRAIYVVAKVAGNTNVMSHFPHEVMNLETVFHCLLVWQQTSHLHREWEVRYCMLLWLSNLILAPFALSTLDSSAVDQDEEPLSRRMLICAQQFLNDASKCRYGAALFIGRMMTRPDAANLREEFFTFATRAIASTDSNSWLLAGGTLQALATTLKLGKREEMFLMSVELIPLVTAVALSFPDAMVCKTAVKTAQRLALTCLPMQASSSWRYKRAVINLEVNLSANGTEPALPSVQQPATPVASNDVEDVPEVVEPVVDVLIRALSHQDTIVRWSAAKGIGRVCERLPQAAVADILAAVFETFSMKENDAGWHGGCLAIAEAAKRAVLLPDLFDTVVEVVERALKYDVSRGSYSVGSHVRDAACYMCWSMARAYNATDLFPWVAKISTGLVTTAIYDREVNVRRAAAAAFQECVGRLGNFPHGITLVTTMDFFSLSALRGAFLDVGPQVGQFQTYRLPMFEHLWKVQLRHWDRNVRTTAAAALGALVPLMTSTEEIDHINTKFLPATLKGALSANIATRHGAIAALAALIEKMPTLTESMITVVLGVMPELHSKRLYRGRGGEWVRYATCQLAASFAKRTCQLPATVGLKTIKETKQVETTAFIIEFLEECWKQPLEWLQTAACEALDVFLRAFFDDVEESAVLEKLLPRLLTGVKEERAPNERRGCLLAMAALPKVFIEKTIGDEKTSTTASAAGEKPAPLSSCFEALLHCCRLEASTDAQDAESRRNSSKALGAAFSRLHLSVPSRSTKRDIHNDAKSVVDSLHICLGDYAIDKRGDVGSYVRLEAMRGYLQLITDMSDAKERGNEDGLTLLKGLPWTMIVGDLMKQATEKIDRVRGLAGSMLSQILQKVHTCCGPEVACHIPQFETLLSVVSPTVDWSAPGDSFTLLCPLLSYEEYRRPLLEGLVLSVGGMSAHVVKAAFHSLVIEFQREGQRTLLSRGLVEIARDCANDDRIVPPLYIALNKLLTACEFDPELAPELLPLIASETKHFTKDVQKILVSFVPVTASLSLIPGARKGAWAQCLALIGSRYPKVRASVATEMYTSLTAAMSDPSLLSAGEQDAFPKALDLLIGTQWDGTNATLIRSQRDVLYNLLEIEKPVVTKDAAAPTGSRRTDAGTYKSLVRETGY